MIILSPHTADTLSPLAEDQSWVMFVQVMAPVGVNPIKIEGVTGTQIAARLRAIDADNAFETYLVGLLNLGDGLSDHKDPTAVADAIGQQFSSARLRHDWFQPTIDLLTFIQAHGQEALQALLSQARSWNVPDGAVDINELAEFLGVSKSTVRRMTARREIPHFRVGKALRYVPAEVLAALQRG